MFPFRRRKSDGSATPTSPSGGQKEVRVIPDVEEEGQPAPGTVPGHAIRRYASVGEYLQMIGYMKFESQLNEAGVIMREDKTQAATDSMIDVRRSDYTLVDNRPSFGTAPPAVNAHFQHMGTSYAAQDIMQSYVMSHMDDRFGQNVGLSRNQVIIYLICAFIGLGVVVLPSLMKAGGWFMAPILSLLTVFAFIEMCRVLCESLEVAEDLRWRVTGASAPLVKEKSDPVTSPSGRKGSKERLSSKERTSSKERPSSNERPGSNELQQPSAELEARATYWRYNPADSKERRPRTKMDINGTLQELIIKPGDVVQVRQEVQGKDGVLYLQLENGGGWLFDQKPGVGSICVRELITSFEEIGRTALEDVGVFMIRSITLPGFFCSVVVYALLIGQNVSALLARTLSTRTIMVFVTPFLIIISVLQDTALAKAMSVGMCASLSSCVLICIKGMLDASIWQSWPEEDRDDVHMLWPREVSSFGTMLAVLFSAYSVMGTVPCIRGQMAEPKEFFPAFKISIGVVFVVYSSVMFAAYWGYGANVENNVVHSMMFPPRQPCDAGYGESEPAVSPCQTLLATGTAAWSNPIGVTMAVLVTVYLFLGFGLMFKCLSGLLQNFWPGHPCFDSDRVENKIFRSIVVMFTVAVGLGLPHFRDFIEIGASICCSCNNVFFPLIFEYKLSQKIGRPQSTRRRIVHFCIVVMATVCLCLGLYHGITHLASSLQGHSAATSTTTVQTTLETTLAPTTSHKMVSFVFGGS